MDNPRRPQSPAVSNSRSWPPVYVVLHSTTKHMELELGTYRCYNECATCLHFAFCCCCCIVAILRSHLIPISLLLFAHFLCFNQTCQIFHMRHFTCSSDSYTAFSSSLQKFAQYKDVTVSHLSFHLQHVLSHFLDYLETLRGTRFNEHLEQHNPLGEGPSQCGNSHSNKDKQML